MRTLLGAIGLFVVTVSCRETAAPTLNTDDYVGTYPLAQVDGHPIGWFHQLNGVNCRAAFTVGTLSISEDEWHLGLEYDYRCLGAVSGDGRSALGASGKVVRSTSEVIVLMGVGTGFIYPGASAWTIEVRPLHDFVEVRFTGDNRDYWADPIITMGPRQPQPPAASR